MVITIVVFFDTFFASFSVSPNVVRQNSNDIKLNCECMITQHPLWQIG